MSTRVELQTSVNHLYSEDGCGNRREKIALAKFTVRYFFFLKNARKIRIFKSSYSLHLFYFSITELSET